MKETHIILPNQTMAADDEVSVRRPTADSDAPHSIQHGSRGIVGPHSCRWRRSVWLLQLGTIALRDDMGCRILDDGATCQTGGSVRRTGRSQAV